MPDEPIAHLLADELNEGFQKERGYAESILDYLDGEGKVKDLSTLAEQMGHRDMPVNGLAYELAQTCEIAARRSDNLEEARQKLRRELAHVEREFHGASSSVGASPDVLKSLRSDV